MKHGRVWEEKTEEWKDTWKVGYDMEEHKRRP
jgi:hypothetical protein